MQRIAAGAALGVILAGVFWLRSHDPVGAPWAPPCPTLALAGIHCPGCGTTRAAHRLLQPDLPGAVRFNPAFVAIGVPAFAWCVYALGTLTFTGRPARAPRLPGWLGWTIVGALVAWTIARNLPGASFDGLRPPVSRQAE